jgi:hypothetical protein
MHNYTLICQQRAALYAERSRDGRWNLPICIYYQRMSARYYQEARLSLHGSDSEWSAL